MSSRISVSVPQSYIPVGRILALHRAGESWASLAARAGMPATTLRSRIKAAHGVERLGEISRHAYVRRAGVWA